MLKFKNIFILCYVLIAFVLFNIFAYDISKFNDKVRIFVLQGKSDVRTINEDGLPISHSRFMENFISPFYVVHYGIEYSEILRKQEYKSDYWTYDSSLKHWNVSIPDIDKNLAKQYLKNSLEWLMDNITYVNRVAHFLYDFDWYYKGHANNMLKKGWWSGLTDDYAILLFLRGWDIFKDDRYLQIADELYRSTITPFENYGSLIWLDNRPWIEEYVNPNNIGMDVKMPYVLNGMIYSAYSILAYEKYKGVEHIAKDLFDSVEKNANKFISSYWFKYDLIGTNTNIKYHLVTKSLFKRLYEDGLLKDEELKNKIEIMDKLDMLLAVHYMINGQRSFSWLQFCILFIFVVFLPLHYILLKRVIYSFFKWRRS